MAKQDLRERIWDELEASGDARFPFPPHGRIPNFAGADEAARRLAETAAWRAAETVKSNPDAPQRPVRRRALEAGKTVYMAVPRLAEERPFRRLDPGEIDDYDHASTLGGSEELGVQVHPDGMDPVELIVSGSVAVTPGGARLGKGEGYSDLEFAILRAAGLVDDDTTTATTVHPIQVVDETVPTTAHDVPIDLVVTPDRVVREAESEKPAGIRWDELDAERVAEMPILEELRPG